MKNVRIRTLIMSSVILSVIPLILLLFLLFSYSITRNRQYQNDLTVKNEEAVIASLKSSADDIRKRTDRILQCSAFLFFTNSSGKERVYRCANQLLPVLQDELQIYPELSGILLYNSQQDHSFQYFTELSTVRITEQLLNTLTDFPKPRRSVFIPLEIDGKAWLLYHTSQRYGSVGILIDPEKNPVYQSFSGTLTNEDRCFFSLLNNASASDEAVVSASLPDYGLYLHYIQERSSLSGRLDPLQKGILAAFCIFFVLFALIWMYVQLQLLSPLSKLLNAFLKVSHGEQDYRLETKSRLSEISRIYQSFNGMLDSVELAEEESHRQRMDAIQAKLQYLQLQIRPHFYLNCLKNINSLAAVHKDEEIQELVIFLSDYFRYNFQDVKNFVTVQEELEAVQSYVNLCRCLYYHLDLSFQLDNAVLQVKCLPMTILTFVENCIKHGGNIQTLKIRISASARFNEEEEPEAMIEIRNNGAFLEETLQELNQPSEHGFSYRKDHVGISNVRYRMYLIYGDRASVRFLNDDDDAVVQTVFPIENYGSAGGDLI